MSILYKETPEHAASLIQTAIKHNVDQGINTLHELLDTILNTKHFESWENIVPWLKALVTDGSSWDTFAKKVRDKDDSPFCGCVWTSDFVAYRCRTCATSPCMSLCAACFERGNHEGHDYNMFRSEAGGACDCGDPHVMLVSGFCSHHGPDRIKPQQLPNNFIASAKVVIERVIIAVFQILRYLSSQETSYERAWGTLTSEVKEVLTFLHELVKLGSPIINIVSEFLLSETVYSNLQTCQGYSFLKDESSELFIFHRQMIDSLSKSIASMKNPQIPLGINPKIEFGDSRKYTRLIDELTFWIVRFDFCEPLILFVLNLLPNAEMKREFARAFIRHYARIACTLNESSNSDPLTNRLAERVVHVSVQLFSNEEIALHLAQEEHLIEIFLISLYNVLHMYMDDSKTNPMDRHKYVSMTRGPRGRSHAYWPIASDFGNFLGHTSVALFFLSHEELLKPWVKLMIPFCGMELNHRAMERHIEYEPSNMLNHYYMIRETCASPLLCLLDVLHEPATVHYTKQLVRIFMEATNKFFDAISFTGSDLSHDQISFHYPLHRYISCLISNALKYQGARLEDFDISIPDAKKLIAHPLQIMTSMTEISNNMWVRNGLYIQTQALAYKQHLFSRFHIDADIFLMQMCVSILPAEYFVVTILNRFRIFATLALSDVAYQRLSKNLGRGHPDAEKQPMMVEGALRLLVNVLSNHHCLDISDEELMRREVVSLIACRPRTFSVLSDNISHCHDANQGMNRGLGGDILRKVVNEVAIKREARDAMEQTTYIMKPASWELYDPVFIDQRILYKRDVQEAFKNYYTNLLETGTMEKSSVSITQAWPPYKEIRPVANKYGDMLKVLRCDNLHSVIFLILQKFSTQHPFISETTLSLAIHLLSSALKVSESLPNTVDDTFKDIRLFNFWKSSNIWNKLTEDVAYEDSKTANPFSHVLRRRSQTAESESGSSATDPLNTDGGDTVEVDSDLPRCSFLKLLIKIYNNQTKSYFELPDDVFLARDLKPPSLKNSIMNLLHYTASHSATVHNEICHISSSLKPQSTGDRNSQPTSNPQNEQAQLRRLRAKEAREAMMRKLQEDSKSFLKKSQQMSGQADDAEEAYVDGKVEKSHSSYNCVICLETHLPSTKSEPSSTDVVTVPSHIEEGSLVEDSVASSSVVTVMEMDYSVTSDDQEQMDTTSIIYGRSININPQKTSNNDFGLICFIQETTVLGRRRQVDERFSYESSDELRSCKDFANEWVDLLKNASCIYSMEEMTSLAQTRGIHISTCGHYVHQKCHDDYLHSIEQNDRLMYEESMLHGFTCPICRQMSNFILPVDVDNKLDDDWGVDTALLVMKIYKPLYDNVPQYPQVMEQFFHSILRFNLHQFLMQLADENSKHPNRDNMSNLVKAIPASSSNRLFDKRLLKRKIPIKDIFHMYYAVARYQRESEIVEDDTCFTRLRGRLSVSSDPLPPTGSAARSSDDIPAIFADPFSVLLQILPDLDISLGNFQFIFHLVFRLAYVKSLVFVLRRFSDEERSAWTNSPTTGNKCHDSLRQLVHSLLTKLPNDFFKDDEQFPSSRGSDMFETQTVFSPLSVMTMVEDEMNEFLQLGALLQHHVFENTDEDDPSTSTAPSPFDSHVKVYAKFLGLYNGDSSEFYLHQCFDLAKMDVLIKRWYNETTQCNSLNRSQTRQMIAFGLSHNWKLPRIISMPRKYNTFFQHYRKQTCMYCNNTPVQPTVCLVCGAMVCYKVDCMNGQHPDGGFTTTRHARDCGAGTSIFVIVNSAYVFVMRPRRVCIWGTLYLDENGEEDVGWKRGKPIFLKEQRLELLEKQWRRNLFDHVCKGWSAHNNAF